MTGRFTPFCPVVNRYYRLDNIIYHRTQKQPPALLIGSVEGSYFAPGIPVGAQINLLHPNFLKYSLLAETNAGTFAPISLTDACTES